MIDESKFEKLEKEDMQEVSGGYKPTNQLYDWTCDYCDTAYNLVHNCNNCGHMVEWYDWDLQRKVFGCDYEAYMRPIVH